jgi:transposase
VGVVAQTRHQLAWELIEDLTAIDAKIRATDKQLRRLVAATGSSLTNLNGIGPSGAARPLGDIGDISRFLTAGHFASCNGTAPIEGRRVTRSITACLGPATDVHQQPQRNGDVVCDDLA